MSFPEIIQMIKTPLDPTLSALLLFVGCYSLFFNFTDARYKNHPRAAKIAFIGGWFYIAAGIVILVLRNIFNA